MHWPPLPRTHQPLLSSTPPSIPGPFPILARSVRACAPTAQCNSCPDGSSLGLHRSREPPAPRSRTTTCLREGRAPAEGVARGAACHVVGRVAIVEFSWKIIYWLSLPRTPQPVLSCTGQSILATFTYPIPPCLIYIASRPSRPPDTDRRCHRTGQRLITVHEHDRL